MSNSRKYSLETKTKAFAMYMQGMTGSKIAQELVTEDEQLIPAVTIYAWIRLEKWEEQRDASQNTVLAEIRNKAAIDIGETTGRHLKNYQDIQKVGTEYIKNNPDFDATIDAVRATDIGIKGERQVMSGYLSQAFLDSLLQILQEEITDDAVLERIAKRFSHLGNSETRRLSGAV